MKLKKRIKSSLMRLYCRRFLVPMSFYEPSSGVMTVSCTPEDSHILTGTSNLVIAVQTGGKTVYFRECRKHTDVRTYVRGLIEEYYTEFCPQDASDRKTVENIFQSRTRFRKFLYMGAVNDPSSRVAHFFCSGDPTLLGILPESAAQTERLKGFVRYVWGELYSYHLNGGLKKGCYQTYNAVRELETKRIADRIGLNDLVPAVQYGILRISGKRQRFGTFMEAAPGVCMSRMPVESRIDVLSPSLQHSLSNLNILDVLCYEKDHRPCNYNVMLREGKAVAVCAFDNDSPMSFSRSDISFSTYMKCTPWAKGKHLCRPYIDKNLAQRVLAIEDDALSENCFLNPFQKKQLIKRTRAVKRIIEMTMKQRPEVLLQDDEWSQATMCEELKQSHGRTYLSLFAEDYILMEQP